MHCTTLRPLLSRVLFMLIFLVVFASGVSAQAITPVGQAIGQDKQGHTVYQVHANGIDIGYKLVGSGAPLVMIMGLGRTMDRWPQEVIQPLAKRNQLILIDNRGMGRTTVNEASFTYKLMADDVIGLLDALGVRTSNVLGFSLGSSIVQQLLLSYPERINKAVLYASSIDGSDVIKALNGKIPDDPIVARQIEATALWKTPLERLGAISNPTLLIVGTTDTTVGTESSKKLAAAIPGAWLVQFKNATHRLMDEAPANFSSVVGTFLEMNATVLSEPVTR